MSRILEPSKDAVSTVVAAMLILAVLTTFISAINAYYIPSLASENEIQHMQEVRNSFMEVASITSSGDSHEKVLVPLGSEELPLVTTPSSSGSLTVDPNGSWINITLKDVAVPERYFDNYILDNLTDVSTLCMIKNETSPVTTYNVSLDGDNYNYINVEFFDSSTLIIETKRNDSLVFYNYVAIPNTDGEYFSLDLLDPIFGFADVLEDTDESFSLMLDGSFYIEYEKIPPYEDYEKRYTSDKSINVSTGSFTYRSSNNFWIDQDFIFENGAVILHQSTSNESMIRSRPFIMLDEDGKILNIHMFNVIGVNESMSGNGVSTVNIQVEEHEGYTYPFVEQTNLTIGSEYPSAWLNYLSTIGDTETLIDGTVRASFYNMSVKMAYSDVRIIIP